MVAWVECLPIARWLIGIVATANALVVSPKRVFTPCPPLLPKTISMWQPIRVEVDKHLAPATILIFEFLNTKP